MAQTADKKRNPIVIVIFLAVIILIGFILFLGFDIAMLYWGDQPTYEERRALVREEKLTSRLAQDDYFLNNYGWVNEAKGIVRIPIERAMELTVEDLANQNITPAGFVDPEKARAEAEAKKKAQAQEEKAEG